MDPYRSTIVQTSEQFCTFLDWLRTRRGQYVAVDTETSDADWLYEPRFRVRLIQIGDAQNAWVFAWDGWGRAAAQALTEYRDRILIHNAAYDVAVLQRQGYSLPWAQITDTMLAMRIAEPTKLSALKDSSKRHIDPYADLSQKDLKDAMKRNGWGWDTIPINLPIFNQYAALDPILTARLYEAPVVQEALKSPVWQLEMDTAAICARMAHRGMRIDVEMCQRRYDRLVGEADLIRMKIQHDYGLNIGSTKDCGHWLLADPDAHALMTKSTTGGAISVDKEVLEKVTVSIPGTQASALAAAMLEVRSKEKIAASYFKVFIDRADANSMVHPQILTSEARSGRMSIRLPALQTLPKDDSSGVRGVVMARTDDERLISSDWDQIEMRVAAILSQDEGLLQAFRDADASGGDFFTSMGAQIYHDPGFTKSDPRRRVVKNAMYGSLYGAGAIKIANTAKITLPEATVTLDRIFKNYPGLRALMRGAEQQAKRDGYITTMGGRRLDIDPIAAYKALNYIIQGCLPADAPVLTRSGGYTPIGEFIDGSEVWTGARWAQAVRIPKGEDERIRVHLSDGRHIDCDTRHQFLSQPEGSAWPEWLSVLKTEGVTLVRDAAPVEWGQQTVDYSYAQLFWMGYMLGNGTMGTTTNQWAITFPTSIHEGLADELLTWGLSRPDIFIGSTNSKAGIYKGRKGAQGPKVVSIYGGTRSGHDYWTHLTGGGVARTKRLPGWVLRLDRNGRQAVFNGIYAADGTDTDSTMKKQGVAAGVRPRTVTWEPISPVAFTSVNRALAEDVLTLAGTLGYTGHITTGTYFHKTAGNTSTHHTVLFRKNIKPLTVSSIERLGVWEEMYTLSVDDERHAFATSGVLSKNSSAVLLKRTLVEMACAGLEDYLVVPVHDEVVLSAPVDVTEEVRRVVSDIMPIRDLPLEIGADPSLPMERWGVVA